MTLFDWALAVFFVSFGAWGLYCSGLRWRTAIAVSAGIMASLLAFVLMYPV